MVSGLDRLATEQRRPGRGDLDQRPTMELVALMNDEDATVAEAVRRTAPSIARAVDEVAARVRRGGRMIYVGAGTAGRLGQLDAAEIVPTFGVAPRLAIGVLAGGPAATTTAQENVEDDAAAGRAALTDLNVTADDAIIAIAASGRTPYTVAAATEGRARGALTIGIACTAESPLAGAADIAIEVVVGPEFVTGSTRLKAGTAQKLVLNMISTLAMIRLGKTYGDLMIDVRPTNEKLRHRAVGIVAAAAECEREAAATALADADGETRTAIVRLVTGLSIDRSRALVTEHESLRAAIAASPPTD